MSIWETTFDDAFWLTLAGALFGFGGVVLQAFLKSRCKEFHCWGVSCVREPAPPGEEPELDTSALQALRPPAPKNPTATPKKKTQKRRDCQNS